MVEYWGFDSPLNTPTPPLPAECSSSLTMGTLPRWSAATWTALIGPGWWIITSSSPPLWHWTWSRSWCTGQTPTWITSTWWITTARTGTPLSTGAKWVSHFTFLFSRGIRWGPTWVGIWIDSLLLLSVLCSSFKRLQIVLWGRLCNFLIQGTMHYHWKTGGIFTACCYNFLLIFIKKVFWIGMVNELKAHVVLSSKWAYQESLSCSTLWKPFIIDDDYSLKGLFKQLGT